jgi:hypothetical protein
MGNIFEYFKPVQSLSSDDDKKRMMERRTKIIHKKVRALRKTPAVLDDLPIESFLRIIGIYKTIDQQITASKQFSYVCSQFDELREFIDIQLASEDGNNFAKYDMADYVHNLQLLLVEIVDLDYLEANIHNVREEYRNHVGDIAYRIYTLSKSFEFLDRFIHASPTDAAFLDIKPLYEEKLRIDYGNLINEIRKARLFEVHIESTRRYLISKVFNVLLLSILIPFLILILYAFLNQLPAGLKSFLSSINLTGLALFSSAAIAGAIGSFMSVVLRILGVRDNTQLAQNIYAFKYSKTAVQVAPLTGIIFAILLSFIMFGGLIGGSMFPTIEKINGGKETPSYVDILKNIGEVSKLLVWSFIAGFSERLIPDMVDRLSDKARKADEKNPT